MANEYAVLQRRPPFTGISNANLTAGDVTGASEALNIDLVNPESPKEARVQKRAGFRRLQSFADTCTALLPYSEPVLPNLVSAMNAAPSAYGALIYKADGNIATWATAVFQLDNPLASRLVIEPIDTAPFLRVSYGGYAVDLTGMSTLADLLPALVLLGAVSAHVYATDDTYTQYYPTSDELAAAIPLSTLHPLDSTDLYIAVSGRCIMPCVAASQFIQPSLHERPLLKAGVYPYLGMFMSPATSSFVPMVACDGFSTFIPDMKVEAGPTAAAGANFYECAVQMVYETSQGNDELPYRFVGPLSDRSAATGALNITWTVNPGNTLAGMPGPLYINTVNPATRQFSFTANGTAIPGAARYGRSYYQGSIEADTSIGNGTSTTGGTIQNIGTITTFGTTTSVHRVKYRFYRTKAQTTAAAATTAPLYFVAESALNNLASGSPYIDSVADASLTSPYLQEPITADLTVVDTVGLASMVVHQTALVLGYRSGKVAVSLPDNPFCYSTSRSFQMNGPVLALASKADILYVFLPDGIYAVSGVAGTADSAIQKISDVSVQPISGIQNVVSGFHGSSLAFIGHDQRVYIIDGAQVSPVPNLSVALSTLSPPTVLSLGYYPAVAGEVCAQRTTYAAVHRKWFCGTVGSRDLDVLDHALRWTRYRLPRPLQDLESINGRLVCLLIEPSGTALWELTDDLHSDAGEDIEFRYASMWEDLGDPRTEKQFNRVQVDVVDNVTQNTTLTVATEINYEVGRTLHSVDFDLRLSLGWGESAWGMFPWGDPNQTNVVVPLGNQRARSLRVIFSETSTKPVSLSGWNIEVAATGIHAKNGFPITSA